MSKMNAIALLYALVVPIAAAAPSDTRQPWAPPRIGGGFIQIQGWMRALTTDQWCKELDAMRHLGMKIIVIQYLQYNETSYIPTGVDAAAPDPAGEILKYADQHDMRVFLGTKADDRWWNWDEAYLQRALVERKQLTRRIRDRYESHVSFAGWYFTEEVSGNLSPDRVRRLSGYFRALSDHCKSLRDQPVAFAPYFSHLTPVESMRTIYSDLLSGAGIDIMMVQDGVGARGWDANLEERITPFFKMFREVCDKAGVRLWSDLESFQRRDPARETGFIAAPIDRVRRQLEAVAPYVEEVVTFDFFHYMSPYRGARQRALFDGYCKYLGVDPRLAGASY